MRLIDADALLQMIHDRQCADCESVKADRNGVACAACQWDDAISMIENAPAIVGDVTSDRPIINIEIIGEGRITETRSWSTCIIRNGVMLPNGGVKWFETD